MNRILADFIQCPYCLDEHLRLKVFESEAREPKTPSWRCQNFCAAKNSIIETSASNDCQSCVNEEIISGLFVCNNCQRWYPVKSAIAVILKDELRDDADLDFLEKYRNFLGDTYEKFKNIALRFKKAEGTPEDIVKRNEMAVRDQESGQYDDIFPDDLFQAELDTYKKLFIPDHQKFILELGCGTGRVTRKFLHYDLQFICTDFSFESLIFFQNYLSHHGAQNINLVQCDVSFLPFQSEHFDSILSFGLLCNLPGQELRDSVLEGMNRTLKPAGTLILSTYNWGMLKRLRALLQLAQTGKKEGVKKDGVYYYNHEAAEMRKWLQKYFEVNEIIGTDNRIPILQHLSKSFTAWIDGKLTGSALSLPIFAREMVVRAKRSKHDPGE